MTSGNLENSQGDGGGIEPPPPPAQQVNTLHGGEKVYKSGPLFLSSKGIGWTSWKKRWFILTRTSLIFFRSDPNVPQKGAEVNLTLGGIDLNSSGSVVVKEDKKLLTVLFPDGRDGRAFTLKAETLEDLHEWKAALEEVLLSAPNSCLVSARNGILRNDHCDAIDISSEQLKERKAEKSMVLGRPILLALEDIDGTPSFLEKALRFLEEYGVKIEGILRQAADVEDVERRIREYEKGKTEFSPQEDPHIIGDCIKYVLRELPSSPVPASCCNALLEACRTDRGVRVNAVRSAICETFPEPNRRILQRILIMMQQVASNKVVNRMSISAVAACMAPLLLRPLLAGDCDLENDFDMGGDGSVQLLKAAAAANHAQAIVITLLEEYENLFGEGSASPEPYTDSEESETESEETTDDDGEDDDSFDEDDDGSEITADDIVDIEEVIDHESSVTSTETDENEHVQHVARNHSTGSNSIQEDNFPEASQTLSSNPPQATLVQHDSVQEEGIPNDSSEPVGVDHTEATRFQKGSRLARSARRPTVWGRAPAKKNLSMESIDLPAEDLAEFQKLESLTTHLSNESANEVTTKEDVERRKHELHERRLALEKDVEKLHEQLQKEVEVRTALEARRRLVQQPKSVLSGVDEKMKADLEEIAQAEEDVSRLMQKADDLELQLNQHRVQNSRIRDYLSTNLHQSPNHQEKLKETHTDSRAIDIASTSEDSSRSQHEPYTEKPGIDKDKKQESSPSLKKTFTQNHRIDSSRIKHSTGILNAPSIAERGASRSILRGEGGGTALSKLSNRLNFLRERRSQIAKELQNMDKGRSSSSHVLNLEQPIKSESEVGLPHDPAERHSEGTPHNTNSR